MPRASPYGALHRPAALTLPSPQTVLRPIAPRDPLNLSPALRIVAFGLILVATVILSRRAESVSASLPEQVGAAGEPELEVET